MPKILAPIPTDNLGLPSGLVLFNVSIGYSREVTVDYIVTDGMKYTKYTDTVVMDKDNISELESLLNDDVIMAEDLYDHVDNTALERLSREVEDDWSEKIN
jgi:hypothetical protein